MDDLISRQAAIDVIDAILPVEPMRNEYTQGITCGAALAMEYVKQLPSAQPDISEDGTLTVTVPKGTNVTRVLVQEDGTTYGALFYMDSQPDIVRCKDCKHKPHPSDDYDYDNGDCGYEIIFPDYRCPCQCDDGYYNRIPDDDWFCGNAERREDG